MQNFSPGRHIPYDRRSRKAVDRLVRKTRREVMTRRVGGIDNSAVLCQDPSCGFCTQILEQVSEDGGTKWKQHLLSDDAANLHYHLEKPSSDSTPSFFGWAKEKFGEECQVQQCGFHPTSKFTF
jgi:hypothetical protein